MADHSMEVTISTSLSIAAFGAAVAALLFVWRTPEPTQLLIYDNETINEQVAPYAAAGQNPIAVVDAAVAEAIARGYVVVDSRIEIKGPPQSILRLADFVAIGGAIGRDEVVKPLTVLPGTTPVPPQPAAPVAAAPPPQTPEPRRGGAEEKARPRIRRALWGETRGNDRGSWRDGCLCLSPLYHRPRHPGASLSG